MVNRVKNLAIINLRAWIPIYQSKVTCYYPSCQSWIIVSKKGWNFSQPRTIFQQTWQISMKI